MGAVEEKVAVRRLHDRLGFGPPGGEDGQGFAATLRRLLDPATLAADTGVRATPAPTLGAPPPRPKKAAKAKKPAKAGPGTTAGGPEQSPAPTDPAAAQQARQQLRQQEKTLVLWWLDRMVAAEVPTVERLTWFWHGHFATGGMKVRSPMQMLEQNETQRRLGLGRFTDLAQAMIVDPAMLHWLDGNQNKVGAANENLSREFMELFALGVGHYSEGDVREAARALTGWVVRPADTTARLRAKLHDNTDKEILGSSADFDAPGFVNLALSRPESAPFVAGRLWFRLVSPNPPTPDAMTRLVDAYGPNRDLRALVSAIATEPAFLDQATALVKQPVEWLVGLARALRVRPSQLAAPDQAKLLVGLRGMGQTPFDPPSVGGWAAGGGWLTTSAGLARFNLAHLLGRHGVLGAVPSTSTANRPEAVAELLGVDGWSARTRNALAGVADDPPALASVAACAPEYVVSC